MSDRPPRPPARDLDDDSRSDIHSDDTSGSRVDDTSASRPGAGPGASKKSPVIFHAALLLGTFITTTCAGALYAHGMDKIPPINDGLPYSVPLMLILVCHELGHYVAARLHRSDASLPYFIPFFPWFGLGTLGAVIGMRRATSDRKKLIDIGAAGPLAGLVVAIPVLLYGLATSEVKPLSPFGLQEGNSLLYALLKFAVKGLWLPDGHQDVVLNPTAWAGWAGLLVTMINLLPIGQLDGGHIATAYFGNRYNVFARRLHRLMPFVAAGVFLWVLRVVRVEMGPRWKTEVGLNVAAYATVPWLVWYGLVGALRRAGGGANHPPVDPKPLPRSRQALFWLMVIVFVGIFMPVPSRQTFGGQPPPEPAVPVSVAAP